MQTKLPAFPKPERRAPRVEVIALSLGLSAILLSGCAGFRGESVTVGAIPDDYRTSHPIIVSEQERAFDIPIASGDRKLTVSMRETVRGVSDAYLSSASGAVRIMTPTGSANAGAASVLAQEIAEILRKEGVPANRIITTPYQAESAGDAAPIRVSFLAISASTGECGRWPEDILANGDENRNYANFGCATQSNLAAQIANPADLLGPRGKTPIDAARRSAVIENYRANGAAAAP